LAGRIEERFNFTRSQTERLTPSLLAKAFRGELAKSEAELAKSEGREFEWAEDLLDRVRSDRETGRRGGKTGTKAIKKTSQKLVARRYDVSTESSTCGFRGVSKTAVNC